MRLRLLARLRRSVRSRPARDGEREAWPGLPQAPALPVPAGGRHRRAAAPLQVGDGPGPPAAQPFGSPVKRAHQRPPRPARPVARPGRSWRAAARAAVRPAPGAPGEAGARPVSGGGDPARIAGAGGGPPAPPLPWYEVAHARSVARGRRDCGPLEAVLHREWDEDEAPAPEAARAIDRLAELPLAVKASLAAGIEAIHVGGGGVPDLDHMGRLRGVPLPSGRATWDACAGAYGERRIVVGSRPSAAPDVMCHEVGHALDDIDGHGDLWQSDEPDFRALYERCLPHLMSAFHRQSGALGRREFFADAFSAIASRQRPALVDMLGGDTRVALEVMLYFNVRYQI